MLHTLLGRHAFPQLIILYRVDVAIWSVPNKGNIW